MMNNDNEKFRDSKKALSIITLIVLIVLILIGIYNIMSISENGTGWGKNNRFIKEDKKDSSKYEVIDINAWIKFDGINLTVENLDNFDWYNVIIRINPGFFKSGYVHKISKISSTEKVKIPINEFAKSDGLRFNPLITKIMNIEITCKTENGRDGIFIFSE